MDHQNNGDGSVGMWSRILSLWTTVAVAWQSTDWQKLASMAAFFYSLALLGEWVWKRFWRPAAERHGFVKRRLRRSTDEDPE